MKPRILLIYTGGTIGMIKDPETGALKSFDFTELLFHIPELKQLDCQIETTSFDEPIDSSDMDLGYWKILGDIINAKYDDYHGFVVLHGSDTMSHTGSALSFMFENLTKPVILTGSQLPIGDLRTDAKENLITSIQLASEWDNDEPIIKEVCVYFEYQLYRANRTAKMNAEHFEAFSSPNYPPLAISGVHLNIDRQLLWKGGFDRVSMAKKDSLELSPLKMIYRPEMDSKVVVLKLFPGITKEVVKAICEIESLRGIILETYGSGNAPTSSWFIDALKQALTKDVRIVNVTQCRGGAVDMGKYETSVALKKLGMVSGYDITTEAALAKMMYLLAYMPETGDFKKYFETSLRGEISV
ncbi:MULTISPECIES: asparaginase [Nonlabens]|uniref:asparaginase n=3 Tax=Nonlabens ulvanivorans TaxID=906888 RepID=A0A081DCV5_NONUL|nr:asparaginase [Nonlabens ulvanivorans]KEZ92775.1 1-alkyl-2-acetylglycerophosphocholine esterase [Nonlabens ulvanivorans]PRX15625.1 L-asparaginase [Nonlabens ulvanivorans]GAK76751.1 L-asparaginase [Nonlabens ulvanivorans]